MITPQQIKQIPASLAAVLQGMRLYPGDHPQVRRQLLNVLDAMRPILLQKGRLHLGFADGTLLVEDLPCLEQQPAILELSQRIRDCKLKEILFFSGVDTAQLLELITQLLSSNEEIADTFAILGIEYIRVIPEEETPREVYRQALNVVESIYEDARLGRCPSAKMAFSAAQKMVSSAISRPYTLLAMTLLKDYDNYTFTHSVNVSVIAITVGRACNLNTEQLNLLGMGGMLHDLGKMSIDHAIITKPGQLSAAERCKMMEHPQRGVEIVSKMNDIPAEVIDIIHHHHLRYDHTGYPESSRNGKLSPLVDMVTIADTFDAMTTIRCYQKPFSPKKALDQLQHMSGSHLHPEYVKNFTRFLGPYPVGTLVRLHNDEIALVIDRNHQGDNSLKLKRIIGAMGQHIEDAPELSLPDSSQILAEVDPFLKGIQIEKYL
ncbi:MAG: HD domain-containing protein [Geopsychrobacter sp.]|nr:HD domain-containing protein [Geopsychrobacter sp.]